MVTRQQIRHLTDEIARQFKPQRIILFGSYAYGKPNDDSDVDLLVIIGRGSTLQKEFEIRQAIHAPFALDVLVKTRAEVQRRLAWNDFFLREVDQKGKLLYEATDATVGGQSRGRLSNRSARTSRPKASQSRRRVLSRAAAR
jgi:predicted nucleotidyltransferase